MPYPPLLISITGASGAILGIRALELLKQVDVTAHLIISRAAEYTIEQETGWKVDEVKSLAEVCYDPEDLGAPVASGSYLTRGMLVVPCSIKTLSAIANSFTDNLIARAADVCLKEGRPLLLAVRETPLHLGHLHLMQLAVQNGAILFPPIPAFYGRPADLDALITGLVGRMLLRIGIDNPAYPRWQGPSS